MKSNRSAWLATGMSVATLFVAGSALAAQNVANTNQKGSLLIWPLITVEENEWGSSTTIIEISNDGNRFAHVECMYVNERKGRVNFDFDLSPKQTASWDVRSLAGDQIHPPPFPTNNGNPDYEWGNPYRGELVCFVTHRSRKFQIAWNHLTGTATVVRTHTQESLDSENHSEAFKYNAWSFAARDTGGLAPDKKKRPHGTPGKLVLSGENAPGVYDACPAYNIANFMPNGAYLGEFSTYHNGLAVVSCNQDLRETYDIHTTKLEFTVWNSEEHSYTGAHACVDSVNTVWLSSHDERLTQGSNFDYDTLQTPNARFQVKGVKASPPCPPGNGSVGSAWRDRILDLQRADREHAARRRFSAWLCPVGSVWRHAGQALVFGRRSEHRRASENRLKFILA